MNKYDLGWDKERIEEFINNDKPVVIIDEQYFKDNYISKDKIKEYYHKICSSVNHFESKNDNNIVLRIKKYLEKLIED